MSERSAIAKALVAKAPGAGDVLCSLRQICKSFDGKSQVVADLDLDVYEGEFLTLLGPSGSGKTTTLMMLAGFEEPTSGSIILEGASLLGVPPYRRNIGMVFQNYALFPHMTVAQNLAFPLLMRGIPKRQREERVREILNTVRLPDVYDRRPTQLSGGQQQRIALARALIFRPEMVLMDEPLGALDKQLREHMQLEIRHLHQELGITIVYVTHDQSEALTMSDRIAVFANGRVQQIAPPNDIYERPANAFVANFIGDNNTLTGRIKSADGRYYVVDCGSGIEVSGVSLSAFEAGDAVQVLVRPEKALFDASAQPSLNRLDVEINERIYLGDHAQILGRLANGQEFVFKTPGNNHMENLILGEKVAVFSSFEDFLIYPESPGPDCQ